MSKTELLKGKGGTYYPPFPVLGLASDGQDIFLMGGGGGATAAKEVPNLIQAFRYNEATDQLNCVASLNTGKQAMVYITYSAVMGQWLASCQAGCKAFTLNVASNAILELCEWTTEVDGKKACQNLAVYSPSGDKIATGGTDGCVRIYTPAKRGVPPQLVRQGAKYKEISDLDFSSDGRLLASCDKTGHCRLWDPSTAEEKGCIAYGEVPGKGKLDVCCARFAPSPGGDVLVIGASGGRGPAYLGLFSLAGQKLTQVLVEQTPLTCLAVNDAGTMACVCLSSGAKKVYSLPQLRCIEQRRNVHELPAPCCAFLGASTVITGSADRAINLLRIRNLPGGGGDSGMSIFVFILEVLILLYLVLHVGVKGAALGQGTPEWH